MRPIKINVMTTDGWKSYSGLADEQTIERCYALPKIDGEHQCRATFWSQELGIDVAKGHALIWRVE